MTSHPLLSSARQDWRTPEWFLDLVREVGAITLDPCTTADNPTQAERFIAPPDCGLTADWSTRDGLAFVNPPYGAHLSGNVEPDYEITKGGVVVGRGRGWAAKIASQAGETIALTPVRTETMWWQELHGWCDWLLLWSSPLRGSRISFVNADTGEIQKGSNLASCVFYRGPRDEQFRHVFGPHGTLAPGRRLTALRWDDPTWEAA